MIVHEGASSPLDGLCSQDYIIIRLHNDFERAVIVTLFLFLIQQLIFKPLQLLRILLHLEKEASISH